jgi:hypothetical protein
MIASISPRANAARITSLVFFSDSRSLGDPMSLSLAQHPTAIRRTITKPMNIFIKFRVVIAQLEFDGQEGVICSAHHPYDPGHIGILAPGSQPVKDIGRGKPGEPASGRRTDARPRSEVPPPRPPGGRAECRRVAPEPSANWAGGGGELHRKRAQRQRNPGVLARISLRISLRALRWRSPSRGAVPRPTRPRRPASSAQAGPPSSGVRRHADL